MRSLVPRSWRALAGWSAAGALVLGGLLVLGTRASADGEADTLLQRARRASTSEPYAGLVDVQWRDDNGHGHTEQIGARSSTSGGFVVGRADHLVVGRGAMRWAGAEGETTATGRAARGASQPPPGRMWDLEVAGSGHVAGRPASFVVARDRDGRVRARFALDSDRGQLLGEDILDRSGHVVRSVHFVEIVTDATQPAVPVVPPGRSEPVTIGTVPDGFLAPAVVGDGYQLLGRYRLPDGSVQLYYSDGVFTLSMFEQTGLVDWSGLPPGGRAARIEGRRTRGYATPAGTVIVWGDRGLVLSVVADGPPEAAPDVVADVSGHGEGGDWTGAVARFVLGPFGWG